ncbi:MAG: hypothetical protein KJ077_10185 [Anaerolineae bacterium]|nr:hypothetical protein [Anaerolineae bacterium]
MQAYETITGVTDKAEVRERIIGLQAQVAAADSAKTKTQIAALQAQIAQLRANVTVAQAKLRM